MRRLMMFALSASVLTGPALAQTPAGPPAGPVERLPSSGGEVIIPNPRWRQTYDAIQFAPARRAGDVLYVSGAIVGRARDEGTDAAAFEAQVRRTFQQLDRTLKAAGATFDDVAMINSFHVWSGPNFTGAPMDQITIINKIKAEFITGPHPAWTAVGTTGLLSEEGIVEIQLIAHAPPRD